MTIEVQTILVRTTADTDIINLSSSINDVIREFSVRNGIVIIFVPGSTAALTTIEYESGAVEDLKNTIQRMAPEELYYKHNERWGDGNGYSHVRAALIGPSLNIPLIDGKLTLGTWQQIVLLDFDNRARERKIIIQISGE